MKILTYIVLALPLSMWAQTPLTTVVTPYTPVGPDTVVARIGGKAYTAAEVTAILKANPPEVQKNYLQDPKTFLGNLALIQALSAMAEKDHLDQQSPAKEALDQLQMQYVMSRGQALANALVGAKIDSIPVLLDEQKKFYEANRDRYTQAKVKMLFISFRSNPEPQTDPKAKKALNEAEAKAKAQKLLADIRAGADFVKLLKANSDDRESVARDGDFDKPIAKSDQWPTDIMRAIFALKPGQVSEPVRVSTGFYLFRLEDLSAKTFEEVRNDIFTEIRQGRFNEWLTKIKSGIELKIENQEFFTTYPAGK